MHIKDYEFQQISTAHFSREDDFDFNAPGSFEQIKSSILETGIIIPIIAFRNKGHLVVIDGYKRYKIALDLGFVSIPTIILPNSVNLFQAIQIRYEDLKYLKGDLNILQKMAIYRLLLKNKASNSRMDWWKKKLNLPANKNSLDKIMRIMTWPTNAQLYLHKYHVSLQNIRTILDQNNTAIGELFDFADLLSIRPVELIEIYNYCNDIALNNNKNFTDIIKHPDIMTILEDKTKNRNQKLEAIKKLLYQWRFPLINHFRNAVEQKLSDLAFPSNIKAVYDKQFENPELILQIRLKNEQTLMDVKKIFVDEKKISHLKSIIELL